MSEQEDRSSDDLTEEASQQRIDDFRNKGQVPQSKEVSGLVALLAAGVTTYVLAPSMGTEIGAFMEEVFRTDMAARLDLSQRGVLALYFNKALTLMVTLGLPISLAAMIIGALGSFAQVGSLFTAEPLTPDLARLDPIKGFQKLVALDNIVNSIRLMIKIVAIGIVTYALMKALVLKSAGFAGLEPEMIFMAYGESGRKIFLSLITILTIFAGLDYGLQRFQFSKKVRMTKQEAKQEHKEREGDPQIKARVRAVQREVARRRMMQAVKSADVIVTNPTHIAIAITYEKDKFAAPKVVAKGADLMAQKIKEIAAKAGVPLVENVPLARTLFKTVKVNQYVPRALYQAVAEVLAYVYRLKNRRF